MIEFNDERAYFYVADVSDENLDCQVNGELGEIASLIGCSMAAVLSEAPDIAPEERLATAKGFVNAIWIAAQMTLDEIEALAEASADA